MAFTGRPPTRWEVQTGRITTPPQAPPPPPPGASPNPFMVAQVRLDSGPTVTAVCCYTAAHATTSSPVGYYETGDAVLVQVMTTRAESYLQAVVYGVLIPA